MEAGSRAEPQYYLDYLNAWACDEQTVRMVITGTEINVLVYIEDVTLGEQDGTGDRYVTVSVREHSDLEAVEVAMNNGTQNNGRAPETSSERPSPTPLSPGDTLPSSAGVTMERSTAKYYNALAKYNGIKNPHLIYPGTTIQIPPESTLLGCRHDAVPNEVRRHAGYHHHPDHEWTGMGENPTLTPLRNGT